MNFLVLICCVCFKMSNDVTSSPRNHNPQADIAHDEDDYDEEEDEDFFPDDEMATDDSGFTIEENLEGCRQIIKSQQTKE